MNKKVNIAYFLTSSNTVGPFKQLVNLVLNLNHDRFNVIFIFSNSIVHNDLIEELDKNNIKFFTLKSDSYFNVFQLFRLVRILRENKIDIIHSRLRRCDFYANIASIFYKCNVINNVVDNQKDHFFKFHKIFSNTLNIIYNLSLRFSKCIIVNNKENLSYYQQRGYKTFYISNGVDSNFFQKNLNSANDLIDKNKMLSESFNVGFVGGFKRVKGIRLLSEIIRHFNNNLEFNFIICGSGNYKKNKFIDEFSNYKNVHIVGYKEDLIPYYSLFDAQIYTSYSEGMPNTLLESMSCGIPAICCDISGYSSIVNSENGFIVKRQSEYYKEKILLLKNKPIIKDKISKTATNDIRNNFSFTGIADKFSRIYLSL